MQNFILRLKSFILKKLHLQTSILDIDLKLLPYLNISEFGTEGDLAFVILKDKTIFYSFISNYDQRVLFHKNKNSLPQNFKEECFGVLLEIIQRYVRENSYWPIPPKTSFLTPGNGFIDLGAYTGFGTIKASKKIGNDGCLVAVEASKEAFNILSKNVKANDLKNVTPIHAAATNHDGKTSLYGLDKQDNSLLQNFYDQIDGGERFYEKKTIVPSVKVDTIIKDSSFNFIDNNTLVSFEINGGEILALEGMKKYLKNGKNFMLRVAARYGSENKKIDKEIEKFLCNFTNIHTSNIKPFIFVSKNKF